MATVSENFLYNLSQSIGISYSLKSNVLGSTTAPNSALFNLNQIRSILLFGVPIFGVYDSPNTFSINFDPVANVFNISSGQVFYNTNLISVPSQTISVTNYADTPGQKYYQFYLDYNDFNLAATIFSATITNVNGNIITVNQLPSQQYLNNFTQVNINGYLLNILSININANTITLNQTVSSFAFVNSTINLIYQPVVKTLITTASSGSPPVLDIPSSGIILGSATLSVSNSLTYSLVGTINTLFVAYPSYTNPVSLFPNQSSYNAFLASVNTSIRLYNTIQDYSVESSLVNSFINYTSSISDTSTTFDQYWHSQPYTPTQFFQYGTGYQGLQKPDFDKRFKDFWYQYQNVDLTRTLAIFRGDIYGGNAYVGSKIGNFNGTVNVSNYIDYSGNSTLPTGTYSYGVSAVTPSGEYIPVFTTTSNNYFNNNVNNYVSWTSPSISNLLFFHVYRSGQQASGFNQNRLTSPFEITGYTLNDTILTQNGTQGIGSSNFAFNILPSSSNSGIIGGIYFSASIVDNTALTGIQSCNIVSYGSNYINPYVVISGSGSGASISLSTSTVNGVVGCITSANVISLGSGYTKSTTISIFDSASNTAGGAVIIPILSQLNCGIYTGTSSHPVGTAITTLAPISIASINSGSIQAPIDMCAQTNFIGLNSNTNYWAVFSMNMPYSLNSNQLIKFATNSTYSTNYATTNDYINWVTGNSSTQIAKLGFLDQGSSGTTTSSNGVYLTDDACSTPVQLQLYIPNMDFSSSTFNYTGPYALQNGIGTTVFPIQNSMTVYVTAQNSATGIQSTLIGNIPKGTPRNTSILLGSSTDVFDSVLNVFVEPNLNLGVNFITNTTIINWTVFDFFSVDSAP